MISYIDRKTMLPFKVTVRTRTQWGSVQDDFSLTHYGAVKGVQLPHHTGGDPYRCTIDDAVSDALGIPNVPD